MTQRLSRRSVTRMSGCAHGRRHSLAEWYRGELDQHEIDRIAATLDKSSQSLSAGGASFGTASMPGQPFTAATMVSSDGYMRAKEIR
jgi:hypothetical protein